jgi:protein involved in polysaccharide export with SLBB domain
MARFPRLRFSLRSLFVLIFGIALGYALNLETWRLLTGASSEARKRSLPTYIIEPPDVLQVRLYDEKRKPPAAFDGQCLVGMDGKINVGAVGAVHVAGLTMPEAREKIAGIVPNQTDSLRVVVDLAGANSKVYYVVLQGVGLGQQVVRVPITGNDTALDAIAQIGGLAKPDSTEIWIARPSTTGGGAQRILPVNWNAISRGASATDNYQLLPGDRVFVSQKPMPSNTQ